MRHLRSLILLALLLAAPVRAQPAPPPPIVYGFVSWNPVEPGMLFELRLIVDGASAIALQLPAELQQIGPATIEPSDIYVPIAVREDAPDGAYTIEATVTVSGTNVLAAVPVQVRAVSEPQPPPLWRYALPLIRR